MSLDIYGIYLNDLSLTDQEKIELIEAVKSITENILTDLFHRSVLNENDQRQTTAGE